MSTEDTARLGQAPASGRRFAVDPSDLTVLTVFLAIAAVVIGGASLFGGRGSMLGTILGVLFDSLNTKRKAAG